MLDIPIYKAEAKLASTIKSTNCIAYCVKVEANPDFKLSDNVKLPHLAHLSESAAALSESDILYPTKSVLVTASWNKNDDVFGVREIWCARHTPIHKPTNIDHDDTQIVGHITNTWAVDSEGNTLGEDSAVDELPSLIHLCNSAVIYKHYRDESLSERAANLIEEIEAGEKYVSMECLFPDFDYAVIDDKNDHYTIARNEDTAFLTKHLRAYGGTGKFQGYTIGRFLKGVIFSGKGYVDKPANPNSIIFTDEKPLFNFSSAKYKSHFIINNGVTSISREVPKVPTIKLNSKEIIMPENQTELDAMKSELARLRDENSSLAKKFTEANLESYIKKIDELTALVAKLTGENESLSTKVYESVASIDALTVSLKDVSANKEALEKAVAEAKAKETFITRVSTLVDAGISKENAETVVAKFGYLTDEQFSDVAVVYAKSLFGEMKRESLESQRNDPKLQSDPVKVGDKTIASQDDLSDVLKDAKASTDDAAVSIPSDDDDDLNKVRSAMASYFAGTLGQTDSSNK